MKIIIESIPHKNHRYKTLGDWYYEDDVLYIKVSQLSNWKRELLIAIHELTEAMLCKNDGVLAGGDEGDMKDAPYLDQHSKALTIERLMCRLLKEDWADYNSEIWKLFNSGDQK